jgi:hypothetical protein
MKVGWRTEDYRRLLDAGELAVLDIKNRTDISRIEEALMKHMTGGPLFSGRGVTLLEDMLNALKNGDCPCLSYKQQRLIAHILEGTWYSYNQREGHRPGYVYLAKSQVEKGSRFKIGRSMDPEKRIAALRTASPSIRLIMYVYSLDMVATETMAHDYLRAYRCIGEWFDLPEKYEEHTALFLESVRMSEFVENSCRVRHQGCF